MEQKFTFNQKLKHLFSLPVIIAALGYFVDIYDLLLFGIVRVPSLIELGLDPSTVGVIILNWQMFGLLLGGILWGILGDKKGRLSVLFGSIITYSLANIACGFLPNIDFMDQGVAYMILRFVAGIGLAGELGAGITLVSESLPKELRAIGTSIVAGFGLFGAVVANFTVELSGSWHIAYWIGGAMGIALLLLRVGVIESGMYKNIHINQHVSKGDFKLFFNNKRRFLLYIKCICIGLPTWYCIGILAMFANEFGAAHEIETPVKPGMAIMWAYVGISAGDFLSGFISHWLQSRKKAIVYMMLFTLIGVSLLLFTPIRTSSMYYFYCVWLGIGTGYWAMFVTVSAEQFGTNIRATAATTIPNFVRGLVIVMTFSFEYLITITNQVILAGAIVGLFAFVLGIFSTLAVPETHGRDLDFLDH
jgi:MFS family permease